MEPPASGRHFTWTNGQSDPTLVKLDRFLVNLEWLAFFPKCSQICLPRYSLNHSTVRLSDGVHLLKPCTFKFEMSWFTVKDISDLLKEWWNEPKLEGCGAFILAEKLAYLRQKLRY